MNGGAAAGAVDPAGGPVSDESLAEAAARAETPTRLVLIRHGESEVTVRRVIGGPRSCSGLSELGHRQVGRLRERLERTAEIAATVLYASQFPRARQTAEGIAPALGFALDEIVVEPGFGEHDPGPECDGLTFDDYLARFGMPDWYGDPDTVVFPGGETIAEFRARVATTVTATVRAHVGGTIVVACHGGVVESAFHALLPVARPLELHTRNTALTEFVLTRRGQWRLDRYNDVAHLAGLPAETPRMSDAAPGS